MIDHDVKVSPSKAGLKREDQLAWKIAGVAADKVAVTKDVAAMIVNRIIDNASVAIASVNRHAIVSARDMALARPNKNGASVFGVAVHQARQPGMGGLGERRGGARTGYARHVPRRRLLASRRQHPADPGGRADDGEIRQGPDPRHRHRLRNHDQPGARDLPARTQDRPHRASVPGAGGRHRHAAGTEAGRHLPGGAAGGACQLHHAPVAQGRDQLLEGVRAGAFRQAGDRGGGPRDARRGRAQPDLRRRGQRHRLDAGRPPGALRRAAAGPRRGQARDPRQLHQGTQRGISVAGADRPRVPHAGEDRGFRRRSRRS